MAERMLYPEWQAQNETTRYPFSSIATLINSEGILLTEGTFLDASLYPVGGQAGLFLTKAVMTHETATLYIGNEGNLELCSGSFSIVSPPDLISFIDVSGRPAGVIVSESNRLAIFQSWGVGEHTFSRAQTEFAATVCVPTPEIGVRGFQLPDGTVLTGEVWLVGDDGVVFRTETVTLPGTCDSGPQTINVIRIDVVGDPLFRRRLCTPTDLFGAPQFIREIRVIGPNQEFTCAPDAYGDIKFAVNNSLAADTVLRVASTSKGLKINAVGTKTGGV